MDTVALWVVVVRLQQVGYAWNADRGLHLLLASWFADGRFQVVLRGL